MKKLLLSAATVLMGLASAFAQKYVTGASISDPSDLNDNAMYYLKATQQFRSAEGYVRGQNISVGGSKYAIFAGSANLSQIPEDGNSDVNYLWRIKKVTEGEYAGSYTVQCVGGNQHFWSKRGAVDVAKNNLCSAATGTDDIGFYGIENIPSESYNTSSDAHPKFWFRLNNAVWPGDNTTKICLRSNNETNGVENLAYWNDENQKQYYVQFEIVEAIEKQETTNEITVTYPAINGWPVTAAPLELYNGQNAALTIKNKLAELGGMANAVISSDKADDSENMTVAEDNTSFTVTGTWDRELVANHVYRITMKPGDQPAAMRYELLSHNINTTSGYNEAGEPETLTRLVPERLWFFKPVEGKDNTYTLHTLYDTEKGVYIEDAATHSSRATLSDDEHPATEFKVNKSTWNVTDMNDNYVGDFYLTFGSSNGLNEKDHYISQWNNGTWGNDHGSAFRLTPLSSDDLETLNLNDGTETTVEEVADAIAEFNGTNVNAALRRIKYMNANDADMFGSYVGQYNNENGDAKLLYEQAVAIVGGQEASDEDKQAIVDGLDPTKLTFKELVPNRFYRFKNKTSGKYISSISSATRQNVKLMDLTTDGTRSNTVFLYHQEGEGDAAVNTLVGFDDGKVMSKFAGDDWTPVLKGSENAGVGSVLTYQNNGRYVIHVDGTGNTHRHLYGGESSDKGDGIVDASGNSTDVDHQWYVEEVTELPITFFNVIDNDPNHTDDGWSSVCVPVALELPDDGHITAYVGEFVHEVNAEDGDVQHIFAKEIEPNEGGKVVIPAGQVALLYYDGKANIADDPNYDFSAMQATRGDIIYARMPINYEYEGGALENGGNLAGSYFAFNQEEGKEYYTLHASYNNYFRQLGSYTRTEEVEGETREVAYFDYVPGFKAYLEVNPDDTEFYQVSTFDPNKVIPEVVDENGADGLTVEESTEEGKHLVTVTLDSDEYVVFFKHTPAASAETPANVRRRAAEVTVPAAVKKEGFEQADKNGNEHTFVVEPGTVDYYAYHTGKNVTSAVRSFLVTSDGDAVSTGIKSVLVNMNGKQVIFDLQGRRMAAPAKGISIINGQKTLVK